jgi:hypothetical protein
VVTDSRGELPDVDRANNKFASHAFDVTVPTLVLGDSASGTIRSGQNIYYQLEIPPDTAVKLSATYGVLGGFESYVRNIGIPDPSTFDEFAFSPTRSEDTIFFTSPSGVAYLLLRGREASGLGQSFHIRLDPAVFEITELSLAGGSNQGSVDITIHGSGFTRETLVHLAAGDDVVATAVNVRFIDSTKLVARLDLTSLAEGGYKVRVADAGLIAFAPNPFNVNSDQHGSHTIQVQVPPWIPVGGTIPVTVTYHNPSKINLPPGTLIVSVTDTVQKKVSFSLPGLAPGKGGSFSASFTPSKADVNLVHNISVSLSLAGPGTSAPSSTIS